MRKVLFVLFLSVCLPVWGRGKLQGWCENGGVTVSIPGTQGSGTQKFQRSYASCTVTVYLAGTTTIATIYSDDSGTAKANPFTAANSGQWFFYADNGVYDIKFSGGGIASPFTIGGRSLWNPASAGVIVVDGIQYKSIAAAYAAGPSTGVTIYVPKTYTTLFPTESAQVSLVAGKPFNLSCEAGVIIGWNIAGYLFDLGATTVTEFVNISNCTFSIGSTATGWLQGGRTSQNSDPTKLIYGWSITNVQVIGPGETVVGKIGMVVTGFVGLTMTNFTLQFFEQTAIFDRCAIITGNHVRFQGYKFGPLITRQAGTGTAATYTCSQCVFTTPEFLGPTTGTLNYGVTVDHGGVTFIGAIYESSQAGNQAFLHQTLYARGFREFSGFISSDGTNVAYVMVWDTAITDLAFFGTQGPNSPICIGVPGACAGNADTVNGNPVVCQGCSATLAASFFALGDGNAVVFGASVADGSLTSGHTSIGPVKFKFSSTSVNTATWPDASGTIAYVITATSSAYGGAPLTAGTCTGGSTSTPGATTAMVATASPVTYPGDGIYWVAYVGSADNTTVKVCSTFTSLTPTSSTYNIRIVK